MTACWEPALVYARQGQLFRSGSRSWKGVMSIGLVRLDELLRHHHGVGAEVRVVSAVVYSCFTAKRQGKRLHGTCHSGAPRGTTGPWRT